MKNCLLKLKNLLRMKLLVLLPTKVMIQDLPLVSKSLTQVF